MADGPNENVTRPQRKDGEMTDTPGMGDRRDEAVEYSASAAAPPAPPGAGVLGDREVDIGPPAVAESPPDDTEATATAASTEARRAKASSAPSAVAPAAPLGLRTEDGRA